MAKCMVHNVEDPKAKDFVLGVNGVMTQGLCGIEIDLKEEAIHVLENAVVETIIKDSDTGKDVHTREPRYRVIRLEPKAVVDEGKDEEVGKGKGKGKGKG